MDNNKKIVYLSMSTDVIHGGHIAIIEKARKLGKVIIWALSDHAISSFKRFPLISYKERVDLYKNIAWISDVIEQKNLSYKENLLKLKPDYVVHWDDWCFGPQKEIREEVIEILKTYWGELIEYPYSNDVKYEEIDERARFQAHLPDFRRWRLKRAIDMKWLVTAMEAHSWLTWLLIEKTTIDEKWWKKGFDAMWISSLCDSTDKGKPDIELVDMTSRFRTIDDIMEVTTKPIIFDWDTWWLKEHFVYTVKTLERMGVSMVIIEDKKGLKKNSLFWTEVKQTQDSIEAFCEKIRAGKAAQKSLDFMICARIESLILEQWMDDALKRAFAFVKAGADAIMIHSRKKDPTEIFEFVEKFREQDKNTPIVVVPTSFNSVTEEEFKERWVNIVIYANQLIRAAFPAMKEVAETILKNHRAKEVDDKCISIKEIITLIPGDY